MADMFNWLPHKNIEARSCAPVFQAALTELGVWYVADLHLAHPTR